MTRRHSPPPIANARWQQDGAQPSARREPVVPALAPGKLQAELQAKLAGPGSHGPATAPPPTRYPAGISSSPGTPGPRSLRQVPSVGRSATPLPAVQAKPARAPASPPPGRASVVQRSGGGSSTTYTLTATEVHRKLFACGGFEYRRKFTVSPAPTKDSIIVQKITRSFVSLEKYQPVKDGPVYFKLELAAVSPDTINSKANSGWTTYWEVFKVSAGSTDAVETDDFALTTMCGNNKKSKSLIAAAKRAGAGQSAASATYSYRTKGRFVQTGEAVFYEDVGVPGGFTVDRSSPAGILPCSKTDPSSSLTGNKSAPVTVSLTAEWDSKDKGATNYGEPTLTIT